jgi:putative MATE family efflux protein
MEKIQLSLYTTRKKKLAAILAMGIPAMFENVLQTLVGFVDTLFVSKISLDAVTAVSIANAIIAIYMAIFMAIGVGASSLIARYIGANQLDLAKQTTRQATILALLAGMAFGVITLLFAEPMLRVMGADNQVVTLGALYLRIAGVPSIFLSLTMVLASVVRATGDTMTPLKISFILNVIHIGLDYVLILMLDFGVAGAAYATVIIRIINAIWLYKIVQKSTLQFLWRQHATVMGKLVRLSTPAAIERLIMRVGQVVYFGLIIKIGADTYAAHMIAENIEAFTFMPGYGMAVVATTFVGACVGANKLKEAYEYGMLSTWVTVVVMSVLGILIFFLCPWMATWFTDEPTVISQIVTALRIDAFAQPAVAMSFVLAGALQGAGDTKTPMYTTAVGMWGLRIVGVYVLGITLNMGIAGVWLALLIDLYVRSLFLYIRFRKTTS